MTGSLLVFLFVFCSYTYSSSAVLAKEVLLSDGTAKGEIGTAVSLRRSTSEALAIYTSARSSFLTKSNAFRRASEEIIPLASEQVTRTATPSRSLKYGASGCRDDISDVASIMDCTNAVRSDPDYFAHDYPCSYSDWRYEVADRDLVALHGGPVVQRLAQLHTNDQARMNSMTHTGSDGSDLQTRADRISLPWGAVGENVAAGFSSAKAVVMAWMCSPAHRKNLMSCDFSKLGVGTGTSPDGRMFYTQVFYCDISETCGCGKSKSGYRSGGKSGHKGPNTRQDKSSSNPVPSKPAPGGSHCNWINNVWTCGEHVQTYQADPYNVYSHQN